MNIRCVYHDGHVEYFNVKEEERPDFETLCVGDIVKHANRRTEGIQISIVVSQWQYDEINVRDDFRDGFFYMVRPLNHINEKTEIRMYENSNVQKIIDTEEQFKIIMEA